MEDPIVNQDLLLQKFPGKGGWTYAEVPKGDIEKQSKFGWVKVKGTIDDYKIQGYSLMPIKGGKLFLPVKSEIRKQIKKQAGDHVRVKLFRDDSVFTIPEEIFDCLQLEPLSYERFMMLSPSHQREYVKWIYSAKKEETKAERINKMINKILNPETK